MSTPVPLTVRVSTIGKSNETWTRDSRIITHLIRDLAFRWTDPGGYATCTVSLSEPLTGRPNYIDFFGTITISDARNGYVVWEGRLEDPSRAADTSQGEVWELSAIGGSAFLRDQVRPRIYIESTLTEFERADTTAGTGSITEDPGGSGENAIVMQYPQGMTVPTNTTVVMRSDLVRFYGGGRGIALVRYSWDGGLTDSGTQLWAVLAVPGVSGVAAATHTINTAGSATPVQIWKGTHWPTTPIRSRLEFKMSRTGAATTAGNDNHWISVFNVTYVATRNDRHGTAIPDANYREYVLAHEVIEDLLGGFGDFVIDSDRANVAATGTTQITQLAYVDGADVEAVLTDLMTFEPGYTWRVWERDPTTQGYVFEWVPIPTSVRYEADTIDGYQSNASSEGVFNNVTVKYRDSKGKAQSTTVGNFDSDNPLTDLGYDRITQIELGDEVGTAAAAIDAGNKWLADHKTPANAGRLRIARPIFDFEWGRMVQPWEIRPGLIRLRGVLPRADALNATRRDGITIFRIVACEYSAADGAATLELDSYAPSMSQLVGQLRELGRPGGKRRDWLNRPYRPKPGRK